MPGFPFSLLFGPSEDEKRRERARREAVGAPIPIPERSYFTTSVGPSYSTSMPTSVVLWDQARPADVYRAFEMGRGDLIRVDSATGALSVAPDNDLGGYEALSADARRYAAASGLTEGYWWARSSGDRPWEPVRLDFAEIEGIEPYLEVWVIGREYAYDLTEYVFLAPIVCHDASG